MYVHVEQCEMPDLQPLPTEAGVDDRLYMECPHCNVVAISRTNWEGNYYFNTPSQPFYGPFSRTIRVSWCQKRTSGLYGARED